MDFPEKIDAFKFQKRARIYRKNGAYFDPIAFEAGFDIKGERYAIYKMMEGKLVYNYELRPRRFTLRMRDRTAVHRRRSLRDLVWQLNSMGLVDRLLTSHDIDVYAPARGGLNNLEGAEQTILESLERRSWSEEAMKENLAKIRALRAEIEMNQILRSV